jgi:hypothetical protein
MSDRPPDPDSLRQRVRDNLVRAVAIAVVVGSALLFINHGDHLAREPHCDYFALKCALTYATPFVVSLVSAVIAARARHR